MKVNHLKGFVLDRKLYSRKYSLISSANSYKKIRFVGQFGQDIKKYKEGLIEKLPVNLKMIEISPMTKAMIGMIVSVLAIAQYLDKVY